MGKGNYLLFDSHKKPIKWNPFALKERVAFDKVIKEFIDGGDVMNGKEEQKPEKKPVTKKSEKKYIKKSLDLVKEEQEHKTKNAIKGLQQMVSDMSQILHDLSKTSEIVANQLMDLKKTVDSTNKTTDETVAKLAEDLSTVVHSIVDISGNTEILTSKETDPICTVRVSMGLTKNLGDFNSAKMQVDFEAPCEASELDAMYKLLRDKSDEKVTEWNKEVHGGKLA